MNIEESSIQQMIIDKLKLKKKHSNYHFEEQWMPECPIDYKLFSYRRYVDDTFLLFSSELHVTKFLNHMNSKHRNIKFTVEHEENNSLAFLNIKIFCDSGKFQTSVYRKPMFSGVLTNFESFLPTSYKYFLYIYICLQERKNNTVLCDASLYSFS